MYHDYHDIGNESTTTSITHAGGVRDSLHLPIIIKGAKVGGVQTT